MYKISENIGIRLFVLASPVVYINSLVTQNTANLIARVRCTLKDNIAQKYSKEKINIFFPKPGIDLGTFSILVEHVLHWTLQPILVYVKSLGHHSLKAQKNYNGNAYLDVKQTLELTMN